MIFLFFMNRLNMSSEMMISAIIFSTNFARICFSVSVLWVHCSHMFWHKFDHYSTNFAFFWFFIMNDQPVFLSGNLRSKGCWAKIAFEGLAGMFRLEMIIQCWFRAIRFITEVAFVDFNRVVGQSNVSEHSFCTFENNFASFDGTGNIFRRCMGPSYMPSEDRRGAEKLWTVWARNGFLRVSYSNMVFQVGFVLGRIVTVATVENRKGLFAHVMSPKIVCTKSVSKGVFVARS